MARLLVLALLAVANAASAITVTTHFPAQASSLFVPPSGRNVVYVTNTAGLFRSDDAGATFVKQSDHGVVLVDPTNADRLYGWGKSGFDRSSDGGVTWQTMTVYAALPYPLTPNHFGIDPRHPATLYMSNSSVPAPFTSAGLLRSDDYGATWHAVGGPAYDIAVDPISGTVYGQWIGSLGIPIKTPPNPSRKIVASEVNPNLRYAIGTETDVDREVLATFDGGKTWQRFGTAGMDAGSSPNDLALDGATGRVFLATSTGLYVSPYGGPFWQHVGGLPAGRITPVAIEGEFLYVGTSIGTYRAPLATLEPFVRLAQAGYASSAVNGLTDDPNTGVLYATSQGVLRSVDAGETWELLPGSDPTPQAQIVVDGDGDVYTLRYDLQATVLFHYSGGSCEKRPSGLPGYWPSLYANPMRHGDLFASTDVGVFHSVDGGRTWGGIVALPPRAALVFDPNRADVIYAAAEQRLISSLDGGQTWSVLNAGGEFSEVAVAPSRTSRLYAVSRRDDHVQRSDDGGATWRSLAFPGDVSRGVAGLPSHPLAVDPLNEDSVWISGTRLWHTIDGGRTWRDETPAVGPYQIYDILMDRNGKSMHILANGEWDAILRGDHHRAGGH